MISKECQEALEFIDLLINEWTAEVNSPHLPLDMARSREAFKIVSRPADLLEAITFKVNGVLSEWVCDADADPDLRILYLHGGGFITGDLDTTEPFAKAISEVTGCAVLSIDYRLSPEHPFPSALNDAVNAFKWLCRNGPEGPAPSKKTFIIGDSAGGGLALSTLLKLRDDKAALPDGAVTLSAFTDLTLSGDSLKSRAEVDPVLNAAFLRFCSSAYASGMDMKNPYISPLFADTNDLPPLFMQVGEREILLDDTLRFAEKATASGVPVTLDVWPEMFHSWQLFAPHMPEALYALKRIGSYIRKFREEDFGR